jgi:hypothetical protein
MPSSALSYFLNSSREVVNIETLQISHSAFSQVYYRQRNVVDGVTVTLENGQQQFFDYYPMAIEENGDQADLDSGMRIDFGDLGEILPQELDRVRAADGFGENPQIVYRCYRSDDLASPLIGPIFLEAPSFSFQRQGASFEAVAPYINNNKTGEVYDLTRFFMLRGSVK